MVRKTKQILNWSTSRIADNLGEKSLEQKINCALQSIYALNKAVELLKSKIKGLTSENQRLNGKLENALGKIEVYEKEISVLVDVLDKTKDAVKDTMISNVAKTLEASTQAILIHIACSASAVKRKRNES